MPEETVNWTNIGVISKTESLPSDHIACKLFELPSDGWKNTYETEHHKLTSNYSTHYVPRSELEAYTVQAVVCAPPSFAHEINQSNVGTTSMSDRPKLSEQQFAALRHYFRVSQARNHSSSGILETIGTQSNDHPSVLSDTKSCDAHTGQGLISADFRFSQENSGGQQEGNSHDYQGDQGTSGRERTGQAGRRQSENGPSNLLSPRIRDETTIERSQERKGEQLVDIRSMSNTLGEVSIERSGLEDRSSGPGFGTIRQTCRTDLQGDPDRISPVRSLGDRDSGQRTGQHSRLDSSGKVPEGEPDAPTVSQAIDRYGRRADVCRRLGTDGGHLTLDEPVSTADRSLSCDARSETPANRVATTVGQPDPHDRYLAPSAAQVPINQVLYGESLCKLHRLPLLVGFVGHLVSVGSSYKLLDQFLVNLYIFTTRQVQANGLTKPLRISHRHQVLCLARCPTGPETSLQLLHIKMELLANGRITRHDILSHSTNLQDIQTGNHDSRHGQQ